MAACGREQSWTLTANETSGVGPGYGDRKELFRNQDYEHASRDSVR
jgi:hypothetical protein